MGSSVAGPPAAARTAATPLVDCRAVRLDTLEPSDLPVVVGRYTLLSLLGEGGMARVFRAEMAGDLGFKKAAAIKIMLAGAGERSASLRKQLIQEARLGALLNHPNVVQTLDCGQLDGFPYITMEFVAGVTLQDLVEGHGPLPPGAVIDAGAQVARGLHHAHTLMHEGKPFPIVHRDVKPTNVLVRGDGIVKVLDFGIAKAYGDEAQLTSTGMTKGTPAYMSPEQLAAEPLDGRSDLFAVGAMLYYLATGKMLFGGQSITEIMMRIVQVEDWLTQRGALEEAGKAVPGLDGILGRLLVRRREDRFPDGESLARALLDLRPRISDGSTLADAVRQRAGARIDSLERTPPPIAARPLLSTVEETAKIAASPGPSKGQSTRKARATGRAADATRMEMDAEGWEDHVTPEPRGRGPLIAVAAATAVVLIGLGFWALRGGAEVPVGAGTTASEAASSEGGAAATADVGSPGATAPGAGSAGGPTTGVAGGNGPQPTAAPSKTRPIPSRAVAADEATPTGAADKFLAATEATSTGAADMFLAAAEPTPTGAADMFLARKEAAKGEANTRRAEDLPVFAAAPSAAPALREAPAAAPPTAATTPPLTTASGEPVLQLRHTPVTSPGPDGSAAILVEGAAPDDALVVLHWGRKDAEHEATTMRRVAPGRWEARVPIRGEIEYWIVASHPRAVPSRQAFGRSFQPHVIRGP